MSRCSRATGGPGQGAAHRPIDVDVSHVAASAHRTGDTFRLLPWQLSPRVNQTAAQQEHRAACASVARPRPRSCPVPAPGASRAATATASRSLSRCQLAARQHPACNCEHSLRTAPRYQVARLRWPTHQPGRYTLTTHGSGTHSHLRWPTSQGASATEAAAIVSLPTVARTRCGGAVRRALDERCRRHCAGPRARRAALQTQNSYSAGDTADRRRHRAAPDPVLTIASVMLRVRRQDHDDDTHSRAQVFFLWPRACGSRVPAAAPLRSCGRFPCM